jgi:hypothetical protein
LTKGERFNVHGSRFSGSGFVALLPSRSNPEPLNLQP